MKPLTQQDILPYEEYLAARPEIRRDLIAYKNTRRLSVGPTVTFLFEDRRTLSYQIMEMVRVEHLVDPEKVQEEIDIYNKLLPRQGELSATVFLQFTDQSTIKTELRRFLGLSDCVYLLLGEDRVKAAFDEGHEDKEKGKIAAVQFARFPMSPAQVDSFLDPNVPVLLSVEHPGYRHDAYVEGRLRDALSQDLTALAGSGNREAWT